MTKGQMVYILVRQRRVREALKTMVPVKVEKTRKVVKEVKAPQKVCPEGKVVNPATRRCIKRENLVKAQKALNEKKTGQKVCPEGKVVNPITGRCIKRENLVKALKAHKQK